MLACYALCIRAHPRPDAFWGDLPALARPLYTANMFVAAAGYLAFTWVLVRHADAARLGPLGVLRRGALILIASALWMPLTLAALVSPPALARWLVPLIWLDLAVVALASLGMLRALIGLPSATSGRRLAIAGAALFCLQTVALDLAVWPWFFHPHAP